VGPLGLDLPLRSIRGIGPKSSEALAAAGLESFEDLLYRLPIRYEDRRRTLALADSREGERIGFLARVRSPRLIRRAGEAFHLRRDARRRHRLAPRRLVQSALPREEPDRGPERLVPRRAALASAGGNELRFENPHVETCDPERDDPVHFSRIVPIYERIGPLSGKLLRSLIYERLRSGALKTDPSEVRAGVDTRNGESCLTGGGKRLESVERDPDEFLPAELLERPRPARLDPGPLRGSRPASGRTLEDRTASRPRPAKARVRGALLLQLAPRDPPRGSAARAA
jgi:hypothetical protein